MLLGIIALKLLTDRPKDVEWLTPEERDALDQRLAAEAEETRTHGYTGIGEALYQSMRDPARPGLFLPGGRALPHRLLDAAGAPDLRSLQSLHRLSHRHSLSHRRDRHGHRRDATPMPRASASGMWRCRSLCRARSSPGRQMPGPFRSSCLRSRLPPSDSMPPSALLVAADLDPDLHRRRGGARAYQLHRQLRWICRASHRWALEGGDGRLHRGASVPCRCARLGRGLALHFGQVEDRRWRARGAA